MIDKKKITPDGLELLLKIMQTCPATPLNGGEHAKKHLQQLCEKGKTVLGCELRSVVKKDNFCVCEGGIIDIYTHFLKSTQSQEVGKLEVMEYFGGNIHGEKILSDTEKDGLPERYALKVIYGHLLIPVIISDLEDGTAVDSNGIVVQHLLTLKGNREYYAEGNVVVMHYGFIVGIISGDEMDILNEINQKSPLYLKAIDSLKDKLDFATMHYYPRSRKMAGK